MSTINDPSRTRSWLWIGTAFVTGLVVGVVVGVIGIIVLAQVLTVMISPV